MPTFFLYLCIKQYFMPQKNNIYTEAMRYIHNAEEILQTKAN